MDRTSYRRRLGTTAVLLASLTVACGTRGSDAVIDRAGPSPPASAAGPPLTASPGASSAPGIAVLPNTSVPPPLPSGQPGRTGVPVAPTALVTPAGVVVPVLGPAPEGGWMVRTPCNRMAVVTDGKAVGSPTIVLDPGHGGAEPGAVSPGGVGEAGVNLAVARQAQQALEAQGVTTLLTRTADYTVELPARAEIARDVAPRAFVSVHHNAEPDEAWSRPGSETYYQIGSADSKRLAGLVYEEVTRALAQYRVAWVADRDAGAKYRPGRQGDYYAMLRLPGKVVSVLAELAFISNPPEAELLARPDVQRVEGEALARGIVRWLRTSDPGSGFTQPYPRTDPPPGPGGPGPVCRDPQL